MAGIAVLLLVPVARDELKRGRLLYFGNVIQYETPVVRAAHWSSPLVPMRRVK